MAAVRLSGGLGGAASERSTGGDRDKTGDRGSAGSEPGGGAVPRAGCVPPGQRTDREEEGGRRGRAAARATWVLNHGCCPGPVRVLPDPRGAGAWQGRQPGEYESGGPRPSPGAWAG